MGADRGEPRLVQSPSGLSAEVRLRGYEMLVSHTCLDDVASSGPQRAHDGLPRARRLNVFPQSKRHMFPAARHPPIARWGVCTSGWGGLLR